MKTRTIIRGTQGGFTLIEIAIVLLVVTILLGYTVALFPIQQELKQYRQANLEMDQIMASLVAFAQINARLPCPDTTRGGNVVDGFEDRKNLDDCEAFYNFLPGRTLALDGDYDSSGRLLDPWGQPYRYAVSEVTSTDGDVDLVTVNGVRNEGIAVAIPDLFICDDSNANGNDIDCSDVSGNDVVLNVAAVVVSTGKDRGTILSNIQRENTDSFDDGKDDKVYIYSTRNDTPGSEYDDVVKWLSTNVLYSKMIEAGQLP